jgi:lysophospholipase L1-like esterase
MSRSKFVFFLFFIFITSSLITSTTISTSLISTQSSSLKLVLIGDSITKSGLGSLYVNNLTSMPYWNNLSIVNSGIPDCSVRLYYDHQYMVDQRVSQYNPDFILVFLGLADASWYADPVTFERDYRWLIDTIRLQCNKSQLLLVKFSWASSVPLGDQEISNGIIEQIALEYQLPFSDVYKFTKGHEEWFIDGVHPNNVGSYQIASCINDSFIGYINGTFHSPVYYPPSSTQNYTSSSPSSSKTELTSPGLLWISSLLPIVFLKKGKFRLIN